MSTCRMLFSKSDYSLCCPFIPLAVGSLQSEGSVISYLLSQLRIGMDLTRITLPTFILEKRSTLEMYADFLAHPDLWVAIGDGETPQARLIACLRW